MLPEPSTLKCGRYVGRPRPLLSPKRLGHCLGDRLGDGLGYSLCGRDRHSLTAGRPAGNPDRDGSRGWA